MSHLSIVDNYGSTYILSFFADMSGATFRMCFMVTLPEVPDLKKGTSIFVCNYVPM
jgi:hypothetical protein